MAVIAGLYLPGKALVAAAHAASARAISFGRNYLFSYFCSGNRLKEGNDTVPFFFYPL
jgi:hypothetical protein